MHQLFGVVQAAHAAVLDALWRGCPVQRGAAAAPELQPLPRVCAQRVDLRPAPRPPVPAAFSVRNALDRLSAASTLSATGGQMCRIRPGCSRALHGGSLYWALGGAACRMRLQRDRPFPLRLVCEPAAHAGADATITTCLWKQQHAITDPDPRHRQKTVTGRALSPSRCIRSQRCCTGCEPLAMRLATRRLSGSHELSCACQHASWMKRLHWH